MTTIDDTNPYPWPYDGSFVPNRSTLVVCGAQQGLQRITRDGGPALAAIDELARRLRAAGGAVAWVRHGATSTRRPTVLPTAGTDDWKLVAPPVPSDLVIDAAGWDGCFCSTLDLDLRSLGRTHVLLAGLASELTVDSTVRTLNDRGYECLVVTDACAPSDPQLGERAFASLTMSGGIFGALGTTTAVLAALSQMETT